MNNTELNLGDRAGLVGHQGRYVNVTFMLKKDLIEHLITVVDGGVVSIRPGPHVMPRWTFALSASDDAWEKFWSPQPTPGFHDLMAMVKFKMLRVEGDQAAFMRHLLYFKALLRRLGDGYL